MTNPFRRIWVPKGLRARGIRRKRDSEPGRFSTGQQSPTLRLWAWKAPSWPTVGPGGCCYLEAGEAELVQYLPVLCIFSPPVSSNPSILGAGNLTPSEEGPCHSTHGRVLMSQYSWEGTHVTVLMCSSHRSFSINYSVSRSVVPNSL